MAKKKSKSKTTVQKTKDNVKTIASTGLSAAQTSWDIIWWIISNIPWWIIKFIDWIYTVITAGLVWLVSR